MFELGIYFEFLCDSGPTWKKKWDLKNSNVDRFFFRKFQKK